ILDGLIHAATECRREIKAADSVTDVCLGRFRVELDRLVHRIHRAFPILERGKTVARNRLAAESTEYAVVFRRIAFQRDGAFRGTHARFGRGIGGSLVVLLGRNFRQIGLRQRVLVLRFRVVRLLLGGRSRGAGELLKLGAVLAVARHLKRRLRGGGSGGQQHDQYGNHHIYLTDALARIWFQIVDKRRRILPRLFGTISPGRREVEPPQGTGRTKCSAPRFRASTDLWGGPFSRSWSYRRDGRRAGRGSNCRGIATKKRHRGQRRRVGVLFCSRNRSRLRVGGGCCPFRAQRAADRPSRLDLTSGFSSSQ